MRTVFLDSYDNTRTGGWVSKLNIFLEGFKAAVKLAHHILQYSEFYPEDLSYLACFDECGHICDIGLCESDVQRALGKTYVNYLEANR